MSIVFMFPTIVDPSVKDMNYTVVVFGGTMILSIMWYYFPKYGGVHWFTGPVSTIDIDVPAVTDNSSGRTSEELKGEKHGNETEIQEVK